MERGVLRGVNAVSEGLNAAFSRVNAAGSSTGFWSSPATLLTDARLAAHHLLDRPDRRADRRAARLFAPARRRWRAVALRPGDHGVRGAHGRLVDERGLADGGHFAPAAGPLSAGRGLC